ncbi:hypothetical protein [Methanosarcina mazei]|uniref:hypothetical protein n=1 Tax=Methanosarcina mazei TaxID=2209 RepID=UPI00064F79E8|nr:hypothetical protein [Methanosarcina mazei]
MKFKTRKISSALKTKGFKEEETHHTYFWFYYNGLRTHIKTRISHGDGEYGDGLLSAMKKQLYLNSMNDLENLIECPMSQEDYIEQLLDKNQL